MGDQSKQKNDSTETIGRRIARMRTDRGWTQQSLAARLAISRVAISHIEMDLSFPSERTVTLLAGLFKIAPHELALNTTYPKAKAEKLPWTVCFYTQLEVDIKLIENDFAWLDRLLDNSQRRQYANEIYQYWTNRLHHLEQDCIDPNEIELIARYKEKLLNKYQLY